MNIANSTESFEDSQPTGRLASLTPVIEAFSASAEGTEGAHGSLWAKLYPFQREIAEFMYKAGSALNASFVGSGKTLTSLAVCQELQSKRTLIIVPKSVLLQWSEIEAMKWLPYAGAFTIVSVTGTIKSRKLIYNNFPMFSSIPAYMVIGYETARTDIEHLSAITWDVVICDEAHRLANTRTKTYKALNRIQSKHRFALTATPIMNKAEDMYGIINWVRPKALGNYWGFINRYCVKDMWGSVRSYKNMDELAVRCKPYIIRKTLEEVGMELPALTEEEIPVELGALERKNYDLIKKELLFDVEKAIISKIESPVMLQNTVVKLGKLFELCDSMELIGESSVSSKMELLKEHLEGVLVNGQKAIVITRFARMAKILAKELEIYQPLFITGATQNRADILKRYESGDNQILIGTEAISQGLNLQVANILYNYDCAWNPARMEQRAGRIYRNGQVKPVFVYNLVCRNTVETWLQKKLVKKQELSDRLLPRSFGEIKEMLG